jgi:dihydrofolate reductase
MVSPRFGPPHLRECSVSGEDGTHEDVAVRGTQHHERMTQVVFDMTVSLDGYVTGPNDTVDNALGEGGERLHDWISSARTDADTEILGELFESGAVVAGRRTYDNSQGPNGWGDGPLGTVPVFVLSHSVPEQVQGGAEFTFVTDGVESAVKQARVAAGDKVVYVMGGADVADQCLAAGLLDEIQLHVAPVLLGGGVRLFDRPGLAGVRLECTRVVSTPGATHIRYRVLA